MNNYKQLAEKIGHRAEFGADSGRYLFKLQRVKAMRRIATAEGPIESPIIEAHPSGARFIGFAVIKDNRPVAPADDVKGWAAQFPGWDPVFA